MSKPLIVYTVFLLLLGCSVQSDVTHDVAEVDIKDFDPQETPAYVEENDYEAYDCSGAWQYVLIGAGDVTQVIVVPVPCEDEIGPDRGRPPDSIHQSYMKSR